MSAVARRSATPRARRLARDRGIALERLAGSGPRGRIVAADIPATAPKAQLVPSPQHPPSAFAASLDLAPFRRFQADAATGGFGLDDYLLKVLALALRTEPSLGELAVVAERGSETWTVPDAAALSLRRIRAARSAAEPGLAGVTYRRLPVGGIRPVAMDTAGVLTATVAAAIGGENGECLLAYDSAVLPHGAAAGLLDRLRRLAERPLAVLA
jgi:pyruvate dehydrogenase E2 component (dihydrolipoamide acetyltransferase)